MDAAAQATALRARIILAASTGATNTAIAAKLGVVIPTVGKWRRRFLRQRLAGLLDEPCHHQCEIAQKGARTISWTT